MFALALFFLRLRASTLFVLAGVWMVLSPVVSTIVRSEFGLEPGYLPLSWFDLATPGPMLTDLFLTGYYPVLQWLSYLLLGMAVANRDIPRHLLAALTAGLGLFVLARGVPSLLLTLAARSAKPRDNPGYSAREPRRRRVTRTRAPTPAGCWSWPAIRAPRSRTRSGPQ